MALYKLDHRILCIVQLSARLATHLPCLLLLFHNRPTHHQLQTPCLNTRRLRPTANTSRSPPAVFHVYCLAFTFDYTLYLGTLVNCLDMSHPPLKLVARKQTP